MDRFKGLIIKHIDIEGPGRLGEFLASKGTPLDYIELENGDHVPENPDDYRFIIILGGPMNVYEEDKYPYLKDEDRFIKDAIKRGTPILGICLGAQLIAKAAGAKVFANPAKEIGWYNVTLTKEGLEDPLFRGLDREFSVFQWHGDTFFIPEGGVMLAGSKLCKNQAFRYRSAYGLQFHVEVTEGMIKEWIGSYQGELDSLKEIIDPAKIIGEMPKEMPAYTKNSETIFKNLGNILHLQ
ncbi:MAG: type 1 glutamine amidotransferase [Nitrospirota bacterium]